MPIEGSSDNWEIYMPIEGSSDNWEIYMPIEGSSDNWEIHMPINGNPDNWEIYMPIEGSSAFATAPPTVILKVPPKGRQSSKSPEKTINSNDQATNSQLNSDKSESLQKSQTLSNNVKTSLNIDSDKGRIVASNSEDSNLRTGKSDLKTDSGVLTVKSDSKVDTLKTGV
ncbi:Hypothetical predicted protein [Mytilus galloprovincialis]|uniref:Uncharacterized protein n=1 Tax=Mytilus galloprovincialis TaxID=29158 RepID=A0A8B6C766_MYTGA|nr:Hypothetical predicted protein [Mytilus galloprovincialis]